MTKKSVGFTAYVLRVTNSRDYSYVLATLKGSQSEAQSAQKKYADGTAWEISKIKLDDYTQTAVISTPVQLCLDLKRSTTSAIESTSHVDLQKALVQSPVPPRTVAETSQVSSTRHQDLLALVAKVDTKRQTKRGDVMDVTVMDGSESAPGSYAQVKIAVMGKEKQDMVSRNIGKPLVFLNLACKVGDGSKQYTSWEQGIVQLPPVCDKTTKLIATAESLQAATNVKMLTNYNSKASVDVSGPQPLSASALLAYSSQNASANLPSVQQLMAAMIEEPTGAVTPDGSERIWFVTKIREFSGCVDVSVSERVALQLTGLDRKTFMEAYTEGALQFPLLCNARISRTIANQTDASQPAAPGHTGASQPAAAGHSARTYVNHRLEDAIPLDWNNAVAPNAAYENVLTLLNALPKNEEGLLFGFLADIRADPYAGFRLEFENGTVRKGVAVAVLVASRKKNNKPEPIGDGFKVCAPEVCDVANPNDGTEAKHALTGFATLNDMAKFEFTPPRGQQQRYAVALITSCKQKGTSGATQPVVSFGMDKMQLLEPADGAKAMPIFQRLRRLTMRLNPSNTDEPSATLNVDEDQDHPLKKARTLCAMPTDTSLKEPEPEPREPA